MTPRYTMQTTAPTRGTSAAQDAIGLPWVYVSSGGRGSAGAHRRIDVSSSVELRVTLSFMPSEKDAVESVLGLFVLQPGLPLLWPVPREAWGADIRVKIENRSAYVADIHVMDHWR